MLRCPGARTCRRDLEPFTQPPPLSLMARMGVRTMPSERQLLGAGRKDLVAAVKQAGGFLEVAQVGGRGPGWWEMSCTWLSTGWGCAQAQLGLLLSHAACLCSPCRRRWGCAASASRRATGTTK